MFRLLGSPKVLDVMNFIELVSSLKQFCSSKVT